MSYICRCEWRAIFPFPISCSSLSYCRAPPFDVCTNPKCFPLCGLLWLLELTGLFTGLHNELLIIPGPHLDSLGPQLSLLLRQVGMVTAGYKTWRRPPKGLPQLHSCFLLYRGGVRGTRCFLSKEDRGYCGRM